MAWVRDWPRTDALGMSFAMEVEVELLADLCPAFLPALKAELVAVGGTACGRSRLLPAAGFRWGPGGRFAERVMKVFVETIFLT